MTLGKPLPLKRPAGSEEVAGAVVFLASDDAAYVTGITIPVEDGACVVDPCGAAVSSSGINWGE